MRTFFFDLDGTLSDSRDGIVASLRAALAEFGVADPSATALAPFLGTPLPEIFRAFVPGLDADGVERAMADYRRAYEDVGMAGNHVYPGVTDMLGAIADGGDVAWVVTSKPQPYAERTVRLLGLDAAFAGIVGAGLDETDTKAMLVARALDRSGGSPSTTVMLGDRHYDVAGALANDVLAVGALWGYGSREELAAAGCRRFADDAFAFHAAFVAGSWGRAQET